MSWWRALKAKRRVNSLVEFWYHPEYAPRSLVAADRVPGLIIDRSELVIGELARERLLQPGWVQTVAPASTQDLLRVHSARYLDASARPEVLARIFGMPQSEVYVDELLTAQRLAVSGTVAAAQSVIRGDVAIGFNLGGGFHHAHPELGSGFCVYNDVAVAIAKLREAGTLGRAAIVDLDFHQGDGNVVTFAQDEQILTFSIHGSTWTHVEAQGDIGVWLPTGTDDQLYLAALQRNLLPALTEHRPDLVFYLAGNDVLEGDRLGDFKLTPQGVLDRDRFVIETVRGMGIPLVITMAGGYSPAAWQCTTNVARWILCDVRHAQVERPPNLRAHFNRVFEELDPAELQRSGDDDFSFTEADFFDAVGPARQRRLLLDYYSDQGIEFALERYGILDAIRRKGFQDINIEADATDPARQLLRLRASKGRFFSVVLVELVARRCWIDVPPRLAPSGSLEVLSCEWLLLQDPTESFTLDRPRLPGQEHPGLGLAKEFSELLLRICTRLNLEGVLNRPAHFHTAAFVSEGFHFIDPIAEGRLLALCQVLGGQALADASTLIEAGRVQLGDGTPIMWESVDHVRPVSERLKKWFASTGYAQRAAAETKRLFSEGISLRL